MWKIWTQKEIEKVYTAGSLEVADWGMDFHRLMLRDTVRMDAYKKAIFEVVKPGMSVCEIGVGTGILSQWALEAGARIVYGIEVNKKILKVAKRNLKVFGDRFVALEGLSQDVNLPEKVDLLLSELLGNIADNENCVPILADAKKRFLKEDGEMLPIEAISYLVPVYEWEKYLNIGNKEITGVHWNSTLLKKFRRLTGAEMFNFYFDTILAKDLYLSEPAQLVQINNEIFEACYEKELVFQATRTGIFTGFKGFFRAQLSPSVVLDIESAEIHSVSWKHAFFSILKPIAVSPGETIHLRFSRSGDNKYSWNGDVKNKRGEIIGSFSQALK